VAVYYTFSIIKRSIKKIITTKIKNRK